MKVRFGPFEVDSDSGRLLKHGVPVRLRDQPFQVLLMLVRNPGNVVTREALRTRLWGESTFVDFENGLNSAISRLRDALGDLSATPTWIETIPKRGYRFIGSLPKTAAATAYLKGHHVISPHTPESMRKSLAFFEEAIALDPDYALAYHGAALVYILRCLLDDIRPLEGLPKADEYLARGLRCSHQPAMVYNTLAMLRTFQRRWEEAEKASNSAIQLEDSNPFVRMIRAQLFSCLGWHDEAIAVAQGAVDLDPAQPRPHMHLVKALYYARRFEECVRAGDAGLEVCPDPYIAFYSGFALIELGRTEEAMRRSEKTNRPETPQAVELAMRGFIAAHAGRECEALSALRVLRKRRESGYIPAIAIAWLEIALKNYADGMEWLLLAAQEGEPYLASARVSPAYDPIRQLPGFERLIALS